MGTFKITGATGATNVQCFVSKYTNDNGSDKWFAIGVTPQSWSRGPGWELVAFRTTADSKRRGWYVHIPPDGTCNITFYGFDRDIGLQYT